MPAYLLLLVAVLSRLLPHAGWMNFTAVGGALLYFGARRSWREMLAPLAALMATDYFLTVYSLPLRFRWQGYVATWAWYRDGHGAGADSAAEPDDVCARGAGALLGPTSFFLLSNYATWAERLCLSVSAHAGRAGRLLCGGLPFYRNDLISTAMVAGLAFGVPVLVRRMSAAQAQVALAGK